MLRCLPQEQPKGACRGRSSLFLTNDHLLQGEPYENLTKPRHSDDLDRSPVDYDEGRRNHYLGGGATTTTSGINDSYEYE